MVSQHCPFNTLFRSWLGHGLALPVGDVSALTCISAAAVMTQIVCKENEIIRVRRRRAPPISLCSREKERHPMTKNPMEQRERTHPNGLLFCPEVPRATKTVFPVDYSEVRITRPVWGLA